MRRGALALLLLAGCATTQATPPRGAPSATATQPRVRLGALMWPSDKAIIYCTRRLDDGGRSVGVAGPCARLEAGETDAIRVVSWATLGRFETSAPDTAPPKLGGRCRFELEDAQQKPTPRPARLTWITPTHKETLDEWTPAGVAPDADAFTIETSLAPEGEWLAILRVAVGLGEGERIVQIVGARLIRVPACE